MKLLLDESLPKRLKEKLKKYQVMTVPDMGWQGKKNGELLRLIQNHFDVFLTADQNMKYQLNLRHSKVFIIVLISHSNRYDDLVKLVPKIVKKLNRRKSLKGVVEIK